MLTDSNAALRQAIQKQDLHRFATELFEARERQNLGLRQRLKKHLSLMQRRLAFKQTHDRSLPGPELTPPPLHHRHGL